MRKVLLPALAAALLLSACAGRVRIPPADAARTDWETTLNEGCSASRRLAIHKLAKLDRPFSRELVKTAVYNDDPFARLAAAEVLGPWHDPTEAVPLLKKLLSDEAFIVRWQAMSSLAQTGSADAAEPLADALENDPDPILRGHAAHSLGRLGKSESLLPLVEALRDEHASVALAAAGALSQITGEPLIPDHQAWKAYTAGDPSLLNEAAEQLAKDRLENKRFVAEKRRGLLATIGIGIKRFFSRADS